MTLKSTPVGYENQRPRIDEQIPGRRTWRKDGSDEKVNSANLVTLLFIGMWLSNEDIAPTTRLDGLAAMAMTSSH